MIVLKLLTPKGMVCRDDDGNPWTTWTGPAHQCSECGREITTGYLRAVNRQVDRYVCPDHVSLNITRFVDGVPA